MNSFDNGCPAPETGNKRSAKRMSQLQKPTPIEPQLATSTIEMPLSPEIVPRSVQHESPKDTALKKISQISRSSMAQKSSIMKTAKKPVPKTYSKRNSVGDHSLQFKEPKTIVDSSQGAAAGRKSVKTSDFIQNIKLKLATMKAEKQNETQVSPQAVNNTGSKVTGLKQKLKQSATAKYTNTKITTENQRSERCIDPTEQGMPLKDSQISGSYTSRLRTIPGNLNKYQLKTRKASFTTQEKQLSHRKTPLNRSSIVLHEKPKQHPPRSKSRKDPRHSNSILKPHLPKKNSDKVSSLGVSSRMLSKIVSKMVDSKNNSFIHE